MGLFDRIVSPTFTSEVILFGLPLDVCRDVVNGIGEEIKAGKRYVSGERYADILQAPYECVFREVHPDHLAQYVG
jgi:hypothetical protein